MRFEPITSEYIKPPFNCGKSDIQRLMENAYSTTLNLQGRAYNVFDEGDVVAQFMLAIVVIEDAEYESVPMGHNFACVKIEYLAVDEKKQHQGIGTTVLKYAIDQVRRSIRNLPIRFIFIESVQDKVEWYSKIGFCAMGDTVRIRKADEYTVPMCIDFIDKEALEAYIAV